MSLSLAQSQIITEMANLVTDFLPASFNNTTSFPIAARNAGVERHWAYTGGKRGSVARMFKACYNEHPHKLLAVIKQIVDLGLTYRIRSDKGPISRIEIEKLNELLLQLNLKIVSLNDVGFLSRLPAEPRTQKDAAPAPTPASQPVSMKPKTVDEAACAALLDGLMAMAKLKPQDRGYEFEKFLNNLFSLHGMEPKKPFRNRGEQIDGSFVHRHDTFLLEAKWQSREVAVRDLYTFASKVETKAAWGRGLFISESGFTDDGLYAFRQGKPTSIVCMNGFDLYLLLKHRLNLEEVLDLKKRHAAETGAAFVSVDKLYPSL
ncbi:restriction endonuclease [Bosea sp. R86505]|uniref:restriction endonuclease n=1 Tax=Bosea sp. R86505 TaxID=3101710 RepID=UPI00366CD6AF